MVMVVVGARVLRTGPVRRPAGRVLFQGARGLGRRIGGMVTAWGRLRWVGPTQLALEVGECFEERVLEVQEGGHLMLELLEKGKEKKGGF